MWEIKSHEHFIKTTICVHFQIESSKSDLLFHSTNDCHFYIDKPNLTHDSHQCIIPVLMYRNLYFLGGLFLTWCDDISANILAAYAYIETWHVHCLDVDCCVFSIVRPHHSFGDWSFSKRQEWKKLSSDIAFWNILESLSFGFSSSSSSVWCVINRTCSAVILYSSFYCGLLPNYNIKFENLWKL